MTFVDKKVTTKPNGIKISEAFVLMIGLSRIQTPGSSKASSKLYHTGCYMVWGFLSNDDFPTSFVLQFSSGNLHC
jgi:hypothetical protein